MEKNYKYFILAGLGGLILAVAYPGWSASQRLDFGFLVWIGLVPLFWALTKSKSPFWSAYSAGLVYFLIVLRWIWDFYPLDSIGINSHFFSIIALLAFYLITVLAMAAFWGLFGFLFSKTQSSKLAIVVIPALFVLIEYARTFGFGLVLAGPGTLFGPHWTMGNFVYGLANNLLILKISSFIGIYGILFCVILANYIFFVSSRHHREFLKHKEKMLAVLLLIAAIASSYLYHPKIQTSASKINYAVIQTNEASDAFKTPEKQLTEFKEQLALTDQIAKKFPGSQLIVLPEASDFLKNLSTFLSTAQVQKYFSNLFADPHLIISGAKVMGSDNKARSRVFALDSKNGLIGYYDKQLLTPGGEFLPYLFRFAIDIFAKNLATRYQNIREFGIGEKKTSEFDFGKQFSVSSLVCSEILSPDLARKTIGNADMIIGMSSTAIFHGAGHTIKELLAIARFRAAENQKPLLFAANMGLSYAIDNQGIVQKIASNEGPQILTGSIVPDPRRSWYNKVGDTPILLAFLLLISCFSLLTWFRKHRRS